jgi:hypothetical protein
MDAGLRCHGHGFILSFQTLGGCGAAVHASVCTPRILGIKDSLSYICI